MIFRFRTCYGFRMYHDTVSGCFFFSGVFFVTERMTSVDKAIEWHGWTNKNAVRIIIIVNTKNINSKTGLRPGAIDRHLGI